MKKFLLLSAAAGLNLAAVAAVPNIYVLGFTAERTGAELSCSYKLNTEATAGVSIELVQDGEAVATYSEGIPGAAGENSCTVTIPGDISGVFTIRLTATGESTAEQTEAWASPATDDELFSWSRARGIAVDNDPESPYYGNLYICGTTGTGFANYNYRGIFIYNYLLERTNPTVVGYTGGIAYSGNSSPLRVTVDENHNVVICDWTSGTRAAAVMNPGEPTADFEKLLVGSVDGVTTNAAISCASITGTDEERVLWTIDEAYNGGRGVLGYKIGDRTTPWPGAPTYDYGNLDGLLKDETGCIISDKRGGLWVSQCTKPFIMHMTAEGTVDYQSPSDLISITNKGGIATDNSGSRLLVGTTDKVVVFDVNFEDEITLTESGSVTVPVTDNLWQVAIDGGDNIYAIGQLSTGANNGISVSALPKEDNSFVAELPLEIKVPTGALLTAAEPEFNYDGRTISCSEPASLYTASGALLARGTTIDTSALSAGVYIARSSNNYIKIIK